VNLVAERAALASDAAQWRSAAGRTRAAGQLVENTTIPPHQFQGLWLPPVVEYGHLQGWFAGLLQQAATQTAGIAEALEEVLAELEQIDADTAEEFARLWLGRSRG
jgi:chorismate mutase